MQLANGRQGVYIATPVPEPAAVLLIGGTALAAGGVVAPARRLARAWTDRAGCGYNAAMTTATEAAIWGRVLDVNNDDLTPDAAAFLLKLDLRESDHARMHELAGKAQDGTLTPDERGEYQDYVRVGHLLAIMQSKAAGCLTKGGPGSDG